MARLCYGRSWSTPIKNRSCSFPINLISSSPTPPNTPRSTSTNTAIQVTPTFSFTATLKPFHNPNDINAGGPHAAASAVTDIDGGKMDGFIKAFRQAQTACKSPDTPGCAIGKIPDVMGWHDAREIPNYWTYAQNFVLQEAMFEPNASWSLPSHLFMVSDWSAKCSTAGDPMSCVNALDGPSGLDGSKNGYAWTDLTYLLHKANVSWAYYLLTVLPQIKIIPRT